MTTEIKLGHFDVEARLQYLDAQIAAHLAERAAEAEAAAARVAAEADVPAEVKIPAPRRVPVFLRGSREDGQFGTLTTTRRTVPRPRDLAAV